MPKLKFVSKKSKKVDVEPADLGKIIAKSWTPAEIADLMTEIMEYVSDNGKDVEVIHKMFSYGYGDYLKAWADRRTH